MTEPIQGFRGEHRWLSNFWPCTVRVSGVEYPSAEHAYVAMKTEEGETRRAVAELPTAAKAKALGRRKTFPLREDWEAVRLGAMYVVVQSKFFQNPELAELLRSTGDADLLEENSWGDRFWGVSGAGGENWLGVILAAVRDELRTRLSFESAVQAALSVYVESRKKT